MAIIKYFIYNGIVESIAAKAREAKTNEELSKSCGQLNIADNIFLGKMDLWLAKYALSTAYRTLKIFPALRNVMHYFGTLNGFINNKDSILFKINKNCNHYLFDLIQQAANDLILNCRAQFKNSGIASAFFLGVDGFFLSGIIVNGNTLSKQLILNNLEYGEQIGYSPKGCNTIKSVIDHEIGHLFDYQLGVSDSREFKKIIREYDIQFLYDNLSHYCVLNNEINQREVIAEAYSEYCNNPSPREVALLIGKLIEKRYKEAYGE